jgi:hypothetical protein
MVSGCGAVRKGGEVKPVANNVILRTVEEAEWSMVGCKTAQRAVRMIAATVYRTCQLVSAVNIASREELRRVRGWERLYVRSRVQDKASDERIKTILVSSAM